MCRKAGPGEFCSPAYLDTNGWIGVRLDLGSVDWVGIAGLVTESYRLVGSKRLGERLEELARRPGVGAVAGGGDGLGRARVG